MLMINKIIDNIQKNSRDVLIKIPNTFDNFNYNGQELRTKDNGLVVNPFSFYIHSFKSIAKKAKNNIDYAKSISTINKNEVSSGDWIKQSTIYSMLLRTSTSYNHCDSNELQLRNEVGLNDLGTFLKTIFLIPYLSGLGINTLYLLPITSYSKDNIKGDLGSVYAVQSFFELENSLYDPITSEEITKDMQFKALCEAAHIYGIRVMIDIIPRTNAINNDFIYDNPEWFYWIKKENLEKYYPPYVEELGEKLKVNQEYMEVVYQNKNVKEFIKLFEHNPKEINPTLYKELQSKCKTKTDIAKLIEENYGLIVAPAFSDTINDPQAPWTDVTFFRMYKDHPKSLSHLLDDINTAPYILFDTIKNDQFQGSEPNTELQQLIGNILPSFQERFGIDGARIDMGHALSKEQIKIIVDYARKIDPDFSLLAEETQSRKSQMWKDSDFNSVLGGMFRDSFNYNELKLNDHINRYNDFKIPYLAAIETHDTARVSSREGEIKLADFFGCINFFIPNSIPFINSGQEIYEIQAMNPAVSTPENLKNCLPKSHKYYNKIALFDKFEFDYSRESKNIKRIIKEASSIRSKYIEYINDLNNIIINQNDKIINIQYKLDNSSLYVIANYSIEKVDFNFDGELLLATSESINNNYLSPFEVRVYKK